MAIHLLDVNVLVALAWSNHVHYAAAREWFAKNAAQGWATCPITQAGFVRVSANPRIVQASLTPAEALMTLSQMISHPAHVFWPDSLSVDVALQNQLLSGYRQVTDAYLAALAIHHNGRLATFDRAVAAFGMPVEVLA
jgi:uncharacterized protein